MRRSDFNTAASGGKAITGIFRARVVAVDEDATLRIKIPKIGLDNIYEGVPFSGAEPGVGDLVYVGFLEGKAGSFVALTGNTSSSVGASITLTDGPPAEADLGDLWFETDTGKTFLYYDSFWVEVGSSVKAPGILSDTDTDTAVKVEATTDDDTIRFDTAGTERLTITNAGHVLPGANEAYDLGSSSFRFRDLYLSGNSIDLGGAVITSDGTSLTLPPIATINGNFTVDSPTFHVDAINNRVGINTTSPIETFHVAGSMAVAGTVDGRDVATDGAKLDSITAGADVTNAATVEPAIESIALTSVLGAAGDEILVVDATDGGLKAVLWENLPDVPIDSVNGQTGAVVLDADDIDDTSTAHKFVTATDITNLSNLSGTNTGDQDLSSYQLKPAEGAFVDGDKTKLDYISVTQAVDLDTIESRVNQLDAAVVLKGAWDASGGSFPGSGSAQAGDSYIVSVAGTVDSVDFSIDDRILAIVDNASTSTYASNWLKLDYTDQVLSVDGATGAVSLSSTYLALSGGTLSGNLVFGSHPYTPGIYHSNSSWIAIRTNGQTSFTNNNSDTGLAYYSAYLPAGATIQSLSTSYNALVVKGVASQTANLQEWRNSAGTALSSVSATGVFDVSGLTVDTTTLHVDTTNNRVGIGSTTPATELDITGSITVSGTVDGRDIATDGSKLDGIETGADVTDSTNVETAIEGITLTSITGATGDEVMVVDATDGGLKAVLWENMPFGVSSSDVTDIVELSQASYDALGSGRPADRLYLITS